jgi:hypothetical protein
VPAFITAAIGAATFAATATSMAIGAAKMIATSVILGAASHLLQKKQKASPGAQLSAQPTQVSVRSPAAPHQIVYGQTRVGGSIVFEGNGSNDGKDYYLNIAIVLACHKCDGLVTIYFDDYPLNINWNGVMGPNTGYEAGKYYGGSGSASHVFAEWLNGDPNQGASSILSAHESAKGWGENHRMRGRCAIVLRLLNHVLPNGKSVWETGFPPNITAVIRGKADVYDPRGNSYGYTPNAALIQADFLASQYGLAATYGSEIDTTLLAAAANVCDEQVPLAAGGTEARYQINGIVSSSATPRESLQALLTASAGKFIWSAGKWQLYAGAWETPTLTLSEDDLAGPIRVQARNSRRDACNRVKGLYVSAPDRYATRDFPPVSDAAYLSEDQGEVITREVEYPYTTSVAAAQRLAKIELQRARRQIRVTAPCKLSAYRARPGQTIYLVNTRMGWTGAGKAFVVDGDPTLRVAADGSYSYDLPLLETDSGVYTWNLEEIAPPPSPATSLANPFVPPKPPAPTLADSDVYFVSRLRRVEGPYVVRRKATISLPALPAGYFISRVEIWHQYASEGLEHHISCPADQVSTTTESYLPDGVTLYAKVRWCSSSTACGPWSDQATLVVGTSDALAVNNTPADPVGFVISSMYDNGVSIIRASWTQLPADDRADCTIRIRYRAVSGSGEWSYWTGDGNYTTARFPATTGNVTTEAQMRVERANIYSAWSGVSTNTPSALIATLGLDSSAATTLYWWDQRFGNLGTKTTLTSVQPGGYAELAFLGTFLTSAFFGQRKFQWYTKPTVSWSSLSGNTYYSQLLFRIGNTRDHNGFGQTFEAFIPLGNIVQNGQAFSTAADAIQALNNGKSINGTGGVGSTTMTIYAGLWLYNAESGGSMSVTAYNLTFNGETVLLETKR